MTAGPRIAVIVPCYNDGGTILDTLASIQNDSETVELVVVDDGSTDAATRDVLNRVAANGVRVLRQENGGLSSARMAGLRATTAAFVFPLDSDDLLIPGRLSVLADTLEARPDLAAVYGDVQQFGDVDRLMQSADRSDPWRDSHINDLPAVALFRREALIGAGGWQLRCMLEDWELWLRFGQRDYRAERVPGAVHLYRQHGSRMLKRGADPHDTIYETVFKLTCPDLFSRRWRWWLRSRAPLLDRLTFPLIELLPVSRWTRTVWKVRVNHIACHRPLLPAISEKRRRARMAQTANPKR